MSPGKIVPLGQLPFLQENNSCIHRGTGTLEFRFGAQDHYWCGQRRCSQRPYRLGTSAEKREEQWWSINC